MTTDSVIGLTGTIVSCISLVASVWFFFSHINRSLEKLIERRLPTLTEDQAFDLLELYLSSVQNDMQRSGRDFVESKFAKCIEDQNPAEAYNTVYGVADSAMQRHRAHLKRFFVAGGQSYEQFLDSASPTDGGVIIKAKQKIYALFQEAITNKTPPPILLSGLVRLMEEAYREAKIKLRERLHDRYQTNSA